MRKVRVGIVFGGRSGEHEVSISSARSVLSALDPDRYDPVPIGITREGQWLIGDSTELLLSSEVTAGLPQTVEAVPDVSHHAIVRADTGGGIGTHQTAVDVVFPLLHGPFGEDGTVQGVFETAGIPYVGSGVLGSSVSMDKVAMKMMLEAAGLPGVPYRLVMRAAWENSREEVRADIERDFTYPVFVKPCNLGSSVGISRAANSDELRSSLNRAAEYDRRIIVEQGIDAREVECGVLGNDNPLVSVLGEVRSHHDWYDYESKYTEGLADLIIPADVTEEQACVARDYARRAFLAVDAAGLARVDLFIRRDDGAVLVNEINTMPGFTTTSMYPKVWEASGLSYVELVDRLILLAQERHDEKQRRSVTH